MKRRAEMDGGALSPSQKTPEIVTKLAETRRDEGHHSPQRERPPNPDLDFRLLASQMVRD